MSNRTEGEIKLIKFMSDQELLPDAFRRVAIFTPSEKGTFIIEAVGGKELGDEGRKQNIALDRSDFGGLGRIINEAVNKGVLKVGDPVPEILLPELGLSYCIATGLTRNLYYFAQLQVSRRISRQEPQNVNPLLWRNGE